MELLKLTRSKKNPDKYYAEFDNGDKLMVNIALIADYSLFTGCELEPQDYDALKKTAEVTLAKARALRIIGHRQMSVKEMTNRLVQKGESVETALETSEWLIKIGAINDADYANTIVRHYAASSYGIGRIRDELYRRGIDKELWEEALRELPEMDESIYRILSRKLKGSKPDKKELGRVTNGLYRRGFSWDEIKTAVDRYMNTEEFTDEE